MNTLRHPAGRHARAAFGRDASSASSAWPLPRPASRRPLPATRNGAVNYGRRVARPPAAIAAPRSPEWSEGGVEDACEEIIARLRATGGLSTCLGSALSPEEQASLLACLDSAQLNVDTCLVEGGLAQLYDHVMRYLEAVGTAQTDDLTLVEGAMLLVEQLSMTLAPQSPPPQQQQDVPAAAAAAASPSGGTAAARSHGEAAEGGAAAAGAEEAAASGGRFGGRWQLLVTTAGGWPLGRLQYVPTIELLEVDEAGSCLRLESKVGPLYTVATADVSWRAPNHLLYQVKDYRLELFGRSLQLPTGAAATNEPNDLLVFAAGPATALARSSVGGMNLLGRPM